MIKSKDGFFEVKGSREYLPDYKSIFERSFFYPGCGFDSMDLQVAKGTFSVYVHADYRLDKQEASLFLSEIKGIDEYKLENIYEFNRDTLLPPDKASSNPVFPLKDTEIKTFDILYQKYNGSPDTFLMGVYVLSDEFTGKSVYSPFDKKEHPLPDFLLVFYFYEEVMQLFSALYFYNKINPAAICISNQIPETPYWTKLAAPDYRFRIGVLVNHLYNHCSMPHFLISDLPSAFNDEFFHRFDWKEYHSIGQVKGQCDQVPDAPVTINIYERDLMVI